MSKLAAASDMGDLGGTAHLEDLDELLEDTAEEDEISKIVRSRSARTGPPPIRRPATQRPSKLPPKPPRPKLAPPNLESLSRVPEIYIPPDAGLPTLDSAPPPSRDTAMPAARTVAPEPPSRGVGVRALAAFAVGALVGVVGVRGLDELRLPGEMAPTALLPGAMLASPGDQREESRPPATTSHTSLPAQVEIATPVVAPVALPNEVVAVPPGERGEALSVAAADVHVTGAQPETSSESTPAAATGQASRDALGDEVVAEHPPLATAADTEEAVLEGFDRDAAASALAVGAVQASGCRTEGAPTGLARVAITFKSSGRAINALVQGPPFAGTPTGSCIARSLRAVTVPPFTGPSVTVWKTIRIH